MYQQQRGRAGKGSGSGGYQVPDRGHIRRSVSGSDPDLHQANQPSIPNPAREERSSSSSESQVKIIPSSSGISEKFDQLSVQSNSSSKCPLSPNFGRRGRPCKLTANHFLKTLGPSLHYFHHNNVTPNSTTVENTPVIPVQFDASTQTNVASAPIMPTVAGASTMANAAGTPSPVVDPYVIHPSESPTLVLSSSALQGDNFGIWELGITKALDAKGKLGFINGTLLPPTDPLTYACWKRADDLVSNWILNAIAPEIRPSCLCAKSAFHLWQELKMRFVQSNMPKIFQLKSAIASLKQENLDVTSYYTRLKGLWDEFDSIVLSIPCICGVSRHILEHKSRDRSMEFLQGLDDRFASLRSHILLIDPFPQLEKVVGLVKQEENQQLINIANIPPPEIAALYFNKQQDSKASSSNGPKHRRPFCVHCNRLGHTRNTCYKLRGFPNKQQNNVAPVTHAHAVTADANANNQALPALPWKQYTHDMALFNPSSNG